MLLEHLRAVERKVSKNRWPDARAALVAAGLQTAQYEIHEVACVLCHGGRTADLTGAVLYAMTALECTSREAADDRQSTLGQIITLNRDICPNNPLIVLLRRCRRMHQKQGGILKKGIRQTELKPSWSSGYPLPSRPIWHRG